MCIRDSLGLDEAGVEQLKRKILAHWDEIQAIAMQVPPAETIAALLATVGGPTTADELGFDAAERELAIANGHYLRDRFTARKLVRVLGLTA